jgi:hypothetical protein
MLVMFVRARTELSTISSYMGVGLRGTTRIDKLDLCVCLRGWEENKKLEPHNDGANVGLEALTCQSPETCVFVLFTWEENQILPPGHDVVRDRGVRPKKVTRKISRCVCVLFLWKELKH